MSELIDNLPQPLTKPIQILLTVKNTIIITASFIMALTFGFVVVARYGFNADLFAYEEWLLVICFWMFFMASAMGTYDKSHINADLLGFVISNVKIVWWRNVIIEVLELLITLAIVYWASLMILEELAAFPDWQTTIALKIPFLVPRFGIWLGFTLMAMYSALHLYALWKTGAPDTREDNQLIPRASQR